MSIEATLKGVFEQTFRPLVPYTPYTTLVTRKDGTTRIRRKSTGNLQKNATKFEVRSSTEYCLYIDESITTDEKGVSYMPFTNEPWISSKWRGLQNPNEGWFPRAVMRYAEAVATALGGKIVISESTSERSNL